MESLRQISSRTGIPARILGNRLLWRVRAAARKGEPLPPTEACKGSLDPTGHVASKPFWLVSARLARALTAPSNGGPGRPRKTGGCGVRDETTPGRSRN